jgi:hypothetical protein
MVLAEPRWRVTCRSRQPGGDVSTEGSVLAACSSVRIVQSSVLRDLDAIDIRRCAS